MHPLAIKLVPSNLLLLFYLTLAFKFFKTNQIIKKKNTPHKNKSNPRDTTVIEVM